MTIKIDLKILIFLLIFSITFQVKIYILLMTFTCLHEMGHLVIGLMLGFKPKEINITPCGLNLEFFSLCEEYNKKVHKGSILNIKRTIIAAIGPITNFIIIVIILAIIKLQPELYNNYNWKINCQTIIYANLLIGAFNLIPIYPLDGGRIIKEILNIILGHRNSEKYTNYISKIMIILLTILSSIMILYIKNISILIILIYLWIVFIKENKRYNVKRKLQKIIDKTLMYKL